MGCVQWGQGVESRCSCVSDTRSTSKDSAVGERAFFLRGGTVGVGRTAERLRGAAPALPPEGGFTFPPRLDTMGKGPLHLGHFLERPEPISLVGMRRRVPHDGQIVSIDMAA